MTDLLEIKWNIEELQKSQKALNLVLAVLENDEPYQDSLSSYFNYTLLPMHFFHSTSSVETAKSKGLDIISNPDIRIRLISVYDSQYDFFLQGEAEELAEVQYGMRHVLPGRFEAGYNYPNSDNTFSGSMIPLDFESLKTDQEYLYFLKTQRNRTRSYIGFFYVNLKKSMMSMIDALELELKSLER